MWFQFPDGRLEVVIAEDDVGTVGLVGDQAEHRGSFGEQDAGQDPAMNGSLVVFEELKEPTGR